MAKLLKEATAANVVLGPFVDETDAVTEEEALTIAQADIRLSKNGAAFAQTNNAAGATHMENGYYQVPLDTTDTDTLGRLRVAVHEAGALPVWEDFMVVPDEVYDSLIAGATGEPGQGAPPASASFVTKIAYLYKAWRNKVEQTATEYSLYADDASTKDQKATVSDDGSTLTRGEMGSGA